MRRTPKSTIRFCGPPSSSAPLSTSLPRPHHLPFPLRQRTQYPQVLMSSASPISAGFESSNTISQIVEYRQALSVSWLFPTSPHIFSSCSEIRLRDGADERESAGVEAPDSDFPNHRISSIFLRFLAVPHRHPYCCDSQPNPIMGRVLTTAKAPASITPIPLSKSSNFDDLSSFHDPPIPTPLPFQVTA